jgi:hypothetical protein
MLVLLIAAAYLAANLYAARAIYGRLRARAIDEHLRDNPLLYKGKSAAEAFNDLDRFEAIGGAVLAAVFWPVVLIGWGVIRFVTHDPPQSRAEMADRIRELETKLGIDTTKRTSR